MLGLSIQEITATIMVAGLIGVIACMAIWPVINIVSRQWGDFLKVLVKVYTCIFAVGFFIKVGNELFLI